MNQYAVKERTYFTNVRQDLIELLPPGTGLRVLEVGAGGGDTLIAMKQQNRAAEVVGVELFELPGSNQRHELIDAMWFGDIEREEFGLPFDHFDAIVCGDVLEHLVDPWRVIEKLIAYLKPGGYFIVSVPNFREFATIFRVVMRNDFAYNPQGGVLDKTHLRFFCKRNAIELLTTPRLRVKRVYSNLDFPTTSVRRQRFNNLTLGAFSDWLTVQHLVVAEKIQP